MSGTNYLWWRRLSLQGAHPYGIALLTAEVLSFVFLWFTILLLMKVRRRTEPVPPPFGTLDVFIPVAGEPIEIVEATLVKALAIAYPHQTYLLNDGFMANTADWMNVNHLARRYGVKCFTRKGGVRGKAGNLNHALKRTHGEFIAVIDADHQADIGLAHQTVGYFHDPDIGFVVTPQNFKMESKDVLGNRELAFYRFIQPAKDAVGAAFSCGNGALYRRSALASIGGFSEWNLVEDLHTSYRLHAAGWKSVYHPSPVTTGLTPETASAFAKQRLGWATDSLRMLLWDNPLKERRLGWTQRLHYFWTTFFYLVMTLQIVFMAGPLLNAFLGVAVMRPPSMDSYLLHAVPYFTLLVAYTGALGGIQDGLAAIFKSLYLSPIYILALFRAATAIRGKPPITSKKRSSGFSWLLMPQYLILGLMVAAVVMALTRPEPGTAVSAAWASFMGIGFATLTLSLGIGGWFTKALRSLARTGLAGSSIALLAGTILSGVPSLRLPPIAQQIVSPTVAVPTFEPHEPLQVLGPPDRGAYFGIFSPELFQEARPIERWESMTGVRPTIVHWYQEWDGPNSRFQRGWAEFADMQGTVPMISWEPWTRPTDGVHDVDQPDFSLRRIAAGVYDPYITQWARDVAAYRRPVFLRFMHEMNGYWYPWSTRRNGNSGTDFVEAWRRTHDIFEREGANNVSWVWSIVGFQGLEGGRAFDRFYPGNAYVDWVGTSTFNWGDSGEWTRWTDLEGIFAETYEALSELGKPVMISELATVQSGGDVTAWMKDVDRSLQTDYPKVKAVVWFDDDYPGGIDFQVHGAAAESMREAFASDGYWSPALNLRNAEADYPRPLAGPLAGM